MKLGCTVAELLDRISSKELTEWICFAQIEPFGSRAEYYGHAITAKTVADVNRPKGKNPYDIEEFMPKFEEKKQTVEQMLMMAEIITAAMGGEDLRSE